MRASSGIPTASRRAVLSTVVAAGATSVLAACGGSGSKSSASASASAPSTSSATATTTATATASSTATASASATPTASVKPKVTVSKAADLAAVKVVGAADKQPVLTYPSPLVATTTVTRALITGTGAKVLAGQEVTIDYTGYVGNTGKIFQSSYTGKKTFTFTATIADVIPGFVKSVVGFPVGSRVLIAIDPTDAYGKTGQPDAGIPANATLLFVVDIHAAKAKLTHAEGAAVAPKAGLPAVTVKAQIPTAIAKPTGSPPAALVVQPLVVGTGPKLTATGPVVFQYIVDLWTTDARNGTAIGSSWTSGTAATVPVLNAETTAAGNGLLAGLKTALIGATVGSRLLVVIPPALGYGAKGNGPIKKNDTTVWCLDVLDDIASL